MAWVKRLFFSRSEAAYSVLMKGLDGWPLRLYWMLAGWAGLNSGSPERGNFMVPFSGLDAGWSAN